MSSAQIHRAVYLQNMLAVEYVGVTSPCTICISATTFIYMLKRTKRPFLASIIS